MYPWKPVVNLKKKYGNGYIFLLLIASTNTKIYKFVYVIYY